MKEKEISKKQLINSLQSLHWNSKSENICLTWLFFVKNFFDTKNKVENSTKIFLVKENNFKIFFA